MTWLSLLFALVQDPAPKEEFRPGLVGHYYHLGRMALIPDLPERPARFERVDLQINFERSGAPFSGTKLKDGLFIQWRGLIRIPKDGVYVFFTRSDDGSRLRIDGKKVVDNDGTHEMTEEDGDVELKAGLHELRVDFFNNTNKHGIILSWKGPEFEKEVIPPHALFHRKRDEPTPERQRGIELPPLEDGEQEADSSTLAGEILRVEGRTIMLVQRKDGGAAEDRVLKVDDEAAVVIDGERAKLEDVKPGRMSRIQVRRDLVVRIELPRIKRAAPAPSEKLGVDETVVAKDEKQPDLGGTILTLFEDGPMTLVTVRQGGTDVVFYIPKDAALTYVGLKKADQKPTVGYLVYAWLKPGSKDTVAAARFASR